MWSRLTILIFYTLFISNNVFCQNNNKKSKFNFDCLLENFELFYIYKNIDSLIISSKKDYSKFISTFYNNEDTIFITNKARINDSIVINYIKNYFTEVYNISMSNKILSLKENKNNVTVFRNKKNYLFFKVFIENKYKYCIFPIKNGLIVYIFHQSNFIKYVYKKQKLIKITLSNSQGSLSIFFDKKLNIKKIFFTNTDYLSCLSEYKRIFYNGSKLKIK
jgi:hypothetical protein